MENSEFDMFGQWSNQYRISECIFCSGQLSFDMACLDFEPLQLGRGPSRSRRLSLLTMSLLTISLRRSLRSDPFINKWTKKGYTRLLFFVNRFHKNTLPYTIFWLSANSRNQNQSSRLETPPLRWYTATPALNHWQSILFWISFSYGCSTRLANCGFKSSPGTNDYDLSKW